MDKRTNHEIVISATVPLTPEFAFIIKKNSSVSLVQKSTFALSKREIVLDVMIRGWQGKTLSDHTVEITVMNDQNTEEAVYTKKTDSDGKASFKISLDGGEAGRDQIRIADITYREPIWLSNEIEMSALPQGLLQKIYSRILVNALNETKNE